jgi:hypothetical protein
LHYRLGLNDEITIIYEEQSSWFFD